MTMSCGISEWGKDAGGLYGGLAEKQDQSKAA